MIDATGREPWRYYPGGPWNPPELRPPRERTLAQLTVAGATIRGGVARLPDGSEYVPARDGRGNTDKWRLWKLPEPQPVADDPQPVKGGKP